MGNSRAGAGGGTTLRDIGQRSGTTQGASGDGFGAMTTGKMTTGHGSRRKPRRGPADRKARSRRRVRRLLVISAIILAGLVVGLIGGMISGIA